MVTGKGGVGRTTIAAALAHLGARRGRRVLLAEFAEPTGVHSSTLAAHFGEQVFGAKPREVAPGVWGVMLQSAVGTERFLTSIFKVPALSRLALRTQALRRMLQAGPSFHELGLFYHLLDMLRATDGDGVWRYDLVVLDMPATGHTLALTGLPGVLLRLVSRGPIANALRAGQAILNDPEQSAACVVTLPEPLPVSECLDLLEGLRQTAMPVGEVLVNRIPLDPFTIEERRALDEMLVGHEVRGLTLVDRLRRSEGALALLRKSLTVPMLGVDEVVAADPALALANHWLGGT